MWRKRSRTAQRKFEPSKGVSRIWVVQKMGREKKSGRWGGGWGKGKNCTLARKSLDLKHPLVFTVAFIYWLTTFVTELKTHECYLAPVYTYSFGGQSVKCLFKTGFLQQPVARFLNSAFRYLDTKKRLGKVKRGCHKRLWQIRWFLFDLCARSIIKTAGERFLKELSLNLAGDKSAKYLPFKRRRVLSNWSNTYHSCLDQ